MPRLLSRGALVWVCLGAIVYACTSPDRKFIDTSAGAGGEGNSSSGGASGSSSGKGGVSGTGTGGDAGGPAGDGGTSTGGSGTGGTRGGSGGTAGTEPGGAGGEAGEPEPPPPPGRPGTAVVAGGEWMRSTNYRLFVISGNGSLPARSSSTNYRLHGGIVGTTQP